LLFTPSPLFVFFNNSTPAKEFSCRIDSGEKIDIYTLFKGRQVFSQSLTERVDFSGIIFILGSLMALYYGFDAFRHKVYIRYQASVYTHRKVFSYIRVSRLILLCSYFSAVLLFTILWSSIVLNFHLDQEHIAFLSLYWIVMLMMLVFFFLIGTIVANWETKTPGFVIIMIAWFFLVYMIPAILSEITQKKSVSTIRDSIYKSEMTKLTLLMESEIYAAKEFGELSERAKTLTKEEKISEQKKLIKKIIDRYFSVEFYKIMKTELDMCSQMESTANVFQTISTFFPTAFYLSLNNEISSGGFRNIISFYRNAVETKLRFLKFYYYKNYLHVNKEEKGPGKLKNFIKGDENIFYGKSRLPITGFVWGFLLSVIYFILLSQLSYWLFRRSLFSSKMAQAEREELKELDIDVEFYQSNVILTNIKKTIGNYLYSVLSGQNRQNLGPVTVRGQNMATSDKKSDFVLFCPAEYFPTDIRVGTWVTFIKQSLKPSRGEMKMLSDRTRLNSLKWKKFGDLSDQVKGLISFETGLLKKAPIYVFHEFNKGMPMSFIKHFTERIKDLKEDGAAIVYITNDGIMGRKVGDYITFSKKEKDLIESNF